MGAVMALVVAMVACIGGDDTDGWDQPNGELAPDTRESNGERRRAEPGERTPLSDEDEPGTSGVSDDEPTRPELNPEPDDSAGEDPAPGSERSPVEPAPEEEADDEEDSRPEDPENEGGSSSADDREHPGELVWTYQTVAEDDFFTLPDGPGAHAGLYSRPSIARPETWIDAEFAWVAGMTVYRTQSRVDGWLVENVGTGNPTSVELRTGLGPVLAYTTGSAGCIPGMGVGSGCVPVSASVYVYTDGYDEAVAVDDIYQEVRLEDDVRGYKHLIFRDGGALQYAWRLNTGPGWSQHTVSNQTVGDFDFTLRSDNSGQTVAFQVTGRGLYFADYGDSVWTESLIMGGEDVGNQPSIHSFYGFDTVAHVDSSGLSDRLMVAERAWDVGTWIFDEIDTASQIDSLTVAQYGLDRYLVYGKNGNEIWLAYRLEGQSGWSTEFVSEGTLPVMEQFMDGGVHIAFVGDGALVYAHSELLD